MSRLRGFDGLRALAASMIVVLHVSSSTGASMHGPGSAYLARLDVGVTVFFVISAFLLYRPFVRGHLDDDAARVELGRFYRRRIVRLYPAYCIALTAVIVLFRDAHISGTGQYLLQYGLVQIYTPKVLAGIIPAWSLAVEVSFYALLPAYAALVGRIVRGRDREARVRIEIASAIVVYALAVVGRVVFASVAGTDTFRLKWLPFVADWFALGLLLAVVASAYAAGAGGAPVRRCVDTVRRRPGALLAAAAVAFVAVAHIGLPTALAAGSVGQDVVRQVLYGFVGLFLVAIAALAFDGGGSTRRVLESRPLVLLGTISYGVFLWHDEWVGRLERWHFARHVPHGTTFALLAVVSALAVVAATASWLLVERPLLRGRDRGAPRVPHDAAARTEA